MSLNFFILSGLDGIEVIQVSKKAMNKKDCILFLRQAEKRLWKAEKPMNSPIIVTDNLPLASGVINEVGKQTSLSWLKTVPRSPWLNPSEWVNMKIKKSLE